MACGRTVMGAAPYKGQQMNLNYFGTMPPSVKACIEDVQAAMYLIGCPLNVFHNEVRSWQRPT
jgi:glutamine synthetase